MTVKIACVVFDCLDALAVGRFWSEAIGRPLDPEASSEFASIGFHGRRDRAGWGPVERHADPTRPGHGEARYHDGQPGALMRCATRRLVPAHTAGRPGNQTAG
jgi:hypothetical protein